MVAVDILNALSNKIYSIFGEEYTIYAEQIKQGFGDKAFFVRVIDDTHTSLSHNDFSEKYNIEILYFPTSTSLNQKNECLTVKTQLLPNLKSLELDDCVIETYDIISRIVDEVLIITCNYVYAGSTAEETEYEYLEEINIDMKGSV